MEDKYKIVRKPGYRYSLEENKEPKEHESKATEKKEKMARKMKDMRDIYPKKEIGNTKGLGKVGKGYFVSHAHGGTETKIHNK